MATPTPSSLHTFTLGSEWAGERLDRALAQSADHLSRTTIQRLIHEGAITLNGRQVTSLREKVVGGETCQILVPEPIPIETLPEEIPLSIVFEDHDLLVIDKPAGLTVHPAPGHWQGTLVNALLHHCRKDSPLGGLSGIGGALRPGIVHRLDRETSGLLVVAKQDPAHRALAEQFKEHTASRTYLALVKGTLQKRSGTIDAPIGRHPQERKKMAVTSPDRGRRAVTHYTLLEPLPPFSLLSCRLETGRTHQIRVHMAHLGHALLGDPLYGRPFTPPKEWPQEVRNVVGSFRRQALHATTLEFFHPGRRERMRFEAPLPADFTQLLAALRQLGQPPTPTATSRLSRH